MASTKQDKILQNVVAELSSRNLLEVIDTIYLFGSRAREDAGKRSDIDLAIECPRASLQQWHAMLAVIDEAETLLKFDVVRLEEAGDQLRQCIFSEGVKIYGS